MARDEFNIDEAEDFDDGTRAILHDKTASDSDVETTESTRLSSSRKQRLQAEKSKSHKQREQASALRVKNWDAGLMESKEYAGKVVKRKDLEEGIESPDEDAMADWSDAEPFGMSEEEEEEKEKEEKEEVHGNNKENENNEDDVEDSEDDSEEKNAEMLIRGFEKEDSARLTGAQDSEKIMEKAKHVRNQKMIWERCLEAQIYTKRLLTTTKDLISQDLTDGELTDEEAVKSRKDQVVNELFNCIEAVSSLQGKLCNVPELSAAESPTKKVKRNCDELWQEIETSSRAMLPQYNNILNMYIRRTDLAAGSKNTQAKKFKAVNQDILAQVESVLVDPQRVKRKAHAPLDVQETDAVEGAEKLDELMYDDSDFYHQLLKEFIESGGGGAGQDGIIKRTHRKKKKNVNRKASKGRQVRYTVHPKLENFMFPEPYPKPEIDVTELFRSLFGQVRQ